MQPKIDAVARPKMDAQLKNAIANSLGSAKIAQTQPINTALDARLGRLVSQRSQPDLERRPTVAEYQDAEFSFWRFHTIFVA